MAMAIAMEARSITTIPPFSLELEGKLRAFEREKRISSKPSLSLCFLPQTIDRAILRASHILIKHQGSRWKASWKDSEGRIISRTTRETVVSLLRAIRNDIVSGEAKFENFGCRISDCNSAERDGDLESISNAQMRLEPALVSLSSLNRHVVATREEQLQISFSSRIE